MEDCDVIAYLLNRVTDVSYLSNSSDLNSTSDVTVVNLTSSDNASLPPDDVVNDDLEHLNWLLLSFIHPLICAFGVLGNILNIVVLTRQRFSVSVDSPMEKAAVFGMAALAVSDLLYCLVTLPEAIFSSKHVIFTGVNFFFLYKMYGRGLQKMFSFTSTGLTVMLALARYIAICHPLQARSILDLRGTVGATVAMTVVCVVLSLPSLWHFKAVHYHCDDTGQSIYMVDIGAFGMNEDFKMAVVTTWFVVCFLLPVIILAFCNIHLIKALRDSLRLRRNSANVHASHTNHAQNVTPTLVAVILVFIILIAPAKVVGFLYYVIDGHRAEHLLTAIVITNTLETLNFSVNFLLYCAVNKKFRASLTSMLSCGRSNKFVTSHATANKTTTVSCASRGSVGMQQVRVAVEVTNDTTDVKSRPEHDTLL